MAPGKSSFDTWRTIECAPSQPASHAQESVSSRPSPLRRRASTRSPRSSKAMSSVRRSTSTPALASSSMSSRSCTSCGRISMNGKGLSPSPILPRATSPARRECAQSLMPRNLRPFAIAVSEMPSCWKNSSVRACITSAREVVPGPSVLSTMRSGTSWRASHSASMRPVGPAPAMSTAGFMRVVNAGR